MEAEAEGLVGGFDFAVAEDVAGRLGGGMDIVGRCIAAALRLVRRTTTL